MLGHWKSLRKIDRNIPYIFADDVIFLVKAIDLIAPDFINLGLREVLEVTFGSLFARLQRGLLFFFE